MEKRINLNTLNIDSYTKPINLNYFDKINQELDSVMKELYTDKRGYACIDSVSFSLDYDENEKLEEPLLYLKCRFGVERDEKYNLDPWQKNIELCVPLNSSIEFIKGVFYAKIEDIA